MRVQLQGWCWFLWSLSFPWERQPWEGGGVTWALFHDEGQVLNLRDKFQILRIKEVKISAWSLHTQNSYRYGPVAVSSRCCKQFHTCLSEISGTWTLDLGRCRLFIRTVPTQFSKVIIQLNQRLHVQCNLSRGTRALWQDSPVNRPKPILHVLTNPRFRPHKGLEKRHHPRRITRWNTNCSEWHALVHVSVNKSFQVIHSLIRIVCSQDTIPSSKYNASFRCFLQSQMGIFWRTDLSFDPAGKMTAVWSVFIGIENGAHFLNKSGRFVRTLSKYATPFVGKFTRKFHPVNWQNSFTSSWVVSPAKQWSIQGVDLRACLHEGGGPQVGEVTRLDGVTRLPI